MIYFSEISNRKIYTDNNHYVGQLLDLVFLATDEPLITKLLVKGRKKNFLIPIKEIVKMNGVMHINKNYQEIELAENELFVVKNLLDKQIIDIEGNKIVRVNDIVIQDKPNLLVVGVDTSLLGILRWLHLENTFINLLRAFQVSTSPKILSWVDIQPLELARGRVKLRIGESKLEKVLPEDLADHLEKTNIVNANKVLNTLDKSFAAEVIASLNINFQTALFKRFQPEKSAQILSLIDADEAVDILLTVDKEKRKEIIDLLDHDTRDEILYLMSLSKTPIGELITSEYFTVDPTDTVRQVLAKVKKETSDYSQLSYIYVVNNQNQLVGVFSMHELLIQNHDSVVYKFMTQNAIVIHLTTPEEIAINKMLKYKLRSLPVINSNRTILGLVNFNDMTQLIMKKLK